MITAKSGVSVALAAALVALSSASISTPALAKGTKAAQAVHCYGVNDCKGQSDCKSGNHECKGMNDCKGQGFKALSKSACLAKHGSLTAPE